MTKTAFMITVMAGSVSPGQTEVHFDTSLEIFILLLQNLDFLLEEHVLLGLLKSRICKQNNLSLTRHADCGAHPENHACVNLCTGWGRGIDGLFEPTTFSRSEIFFSCWCICWFFISTISFRLFKSCSMCWYGAKASCYKNVHSQKTPKQKTRVKDLQGHFWHGPFILDQCWSADFHANL